MSTYDDIITLLKNHTSSQWRWFEDQYDNDFWVQFVEYVKDDDFFIQLDGESILALDDIFYEKFNAFAKVQMQLDPNMIWIQGNFDKFSQFHDAINGIPRFGRDLHHLDICESDWYFDDEERFENGLIELSHIVEEKSKLTPHTIQYDRCIEELAFHPRFMNKRITQFEDIEDFFESMGY
ncbi:unnamed protein product [Phytophthora lilii]|uniref:Unnamed protein product n=1 Tax=Phytophthora lilii TaxID=2077276 RepID=A0A9W6TXX4_9STRA|nr:unnamed protein product [Phytophthora lilii]